MQVASLTEIYETIDRQIALCRESDEVQFPAVKVLFEHYLTLAQRNAISMFYTAQGWSVECCLWGEYFMVFLDPKEA